MNINLSKEFGVPEDVEFMIGTDAAPYKIHNNVLLVKLTSEWSTSSASINYVNNHEIHVVQIITDAEEIILENLSEEYKNGWIARDENEDEKIFAYSTEPHNGVDSYWTKEGCFVYLPYNHLFPSIQYDTGAVKISELLEQKKRSKE